MAEMVLGTITVPGTRNRDGNRNNAYERNRKLGTLGLLEAMAMSGTRTPKNTGTNTEIMPMGETVIGTMTVPGTRNTKVQGRKQEQCL